MQEELNILENIYVKGSIIREIATKGTLPFNCD